MNSLWKYYSIGRKGDPNSDYIRSLVETMKHPSNYLWELYYGGVVKFGNIRIGGRPGSPEIYKSRDNYKLGHFERPP